MEEEQTWELVDDCGDGETITYRLRVPGGWLYRNDCEEEVGEGYLQTVRTMVFVPWYAP